MVNTYICAWITEQHYKQGLCFTPPQIDNTLDMLQSVKWFSTLNLKSEYWKVAMYSENKEKTVFSTGRGLRQFTVVPLGICNASATFEQPMKSVLSVLTYESCLVYLDDANVVSHSVDDLQNLQNVFDRLQDAKLKLKKCDVFCEEVQFLGHVI